MDATDRFLAFAGAQTMLVALIAGTVGGLVLFSPIGLGHSYLSTQTSGSGARLAHQVLQSVPIVVLALYVLIPIAIAGYLLRYTDRHPLVPIAGAVLAVFGLPAIVILPGVAGLDGHAHLWSGLVVALILLGGAVLSIRVGVPDAMYANVALLFLFAVGLFVGLAMFSVPPDGLVERVGASPQAAFAYEYEPADGGRGILTVTHDGGDRLRAEFLSIQSDQLVDVPGAEQTASGPWPGETSGPTWRDGPVVAVNDSVTVGVERDCVVRVIYRDAVTLGKYTCQAADTGA